MGFASAITMASFVFSVFLVLLVAAYNLTSKSIDAPNYSIGSIMAVGIYATSIPAALFGASPYPVMMFSSLLCGVLNWLCYVLVFSRLRGDGRTPVMLTIASLGMMTFISSTLRVIVEWVSLKFGWGHELHHLKMLDFSMLGVPGVFMFGFLVLMAFILASRHLSSTSYGLAYRMVTENPGLAEVQGIDLERGNQYIWLVSGLLAGLAGGILPMWFCASDSEGLWVMPSVIAASLIAELGGPWGLYAGGFFMGFLEIMGTTLGMDALGVWVGEYRFMFSVIVICVTLLLKKEKSR